MSFTILSTRPQGFRVLIEGNVDVALISTLRIELATVLAARPAEVELRVSRPASLGGAGWGLLQSFFDVLWTRGCRVLVEGTRGEHIPVGDRKDLRLLLAGPDRTPAIPSDH
jgi:hypothetical protein